MMKRAFICAAAALLLCAAVAQARVLVAEEEAETGRSLLQRALDCSKTHKACSTCRNQRINGTKKTETVCSTCKAGWRLRTSGTGAQKTCGGSSRRCSASKRVHVRCRLSLQHSTNVLAAGSKQDRCSLMFASSQTHPDTPIQTSAAADHLLDFSLTLMLVSAACCCRLRSWLPVEWNPVNALDYLCHLHQGRIL